MKIVNFLNTLLTSQRTQYPHEELKLESVVFIFIVTDKYPTKIGLVRKAEPRQHNPSELTLNQIRQFYASVPAQNFAWKLHTNTVQGQVRWVNPE